MRIIPELYWNLDFFVACMMGEAENAKILLAQRSVKLLNALNISPGVTVQTGKKRSVKILFITDAFLGHIVVSISFIKDYAIKITEKYIMSDSNGYEIWVDQNSFK